MAKKPTPASKAPAPKTPTRSAAPAPKAAPVSTPVRNTAVPKAKPAAAPKPVVVTYDAISKRAYEIWQSGTGGSEHDNWVRAERELRGS